MYKETVANVDEFEFGDTVERFLLRVGFEFLTVGGPLVDISSTKTKIQKIHRNAYKSQQKKLESTVRFIKIIKPIGVCSFHKNYYQSK